MSRPQWQLQALAAQRRDAEIRRSEELKKVANYFESNTNKSKHHEQWTTPDYYAKANMEAELLNERKIRIAKLEERRKKLELMLYQENLEHQQEIKTLSSQPKLFKNGSYLNNVSTRTLQDINQGIMEKEKDLQRQQAELRLHHAWRMKQPELRATDSYIANNKLKSAWMRQIVEKELQKKRDEEETRKVLQERDSMLRREIELEEQKLKQREHETKELRSSLESQIFDLKEKEIAAQRLRAMEERERLTLDELKILTEDREREFTVLMTQRHNNLINMGLHKYKLKRRVHSVLKEIELDLKMLEKMKSATIKETESEHDRFAHQKRVLDAAMQVLVEYRDKELKRQQTIDAMYDGEARHICDKQERLWEKEREARAVLMNEVITTLRRQTEEKIEMHRQQQRENVLEREKILGKMDSFHQEVRSREREKELKTTSYTTISTLQSQLTGLQLQKKQLEASVEQEASVRAEIEHEKKLRREIARAHREGSTSAWA